MFRIIFVSVA